MSSFTYNTNIPAASHNPSDDQPDMQTNTNSINSWVQQDHYGFETGTDGWHKVMHIPQIAGNSDPAAVTSPVNAGQIYTKTVGSDLELFYESSAGLVSQLTPTGSILPRAAANFLVSAAGVITIQNSFNVKTIVRTVSFGFSIYEITFINNLPTAFYYPSFSGQFRGDALPGGVITGSFKGKSSYNPTVSGFTMIFAANAVVGGDPLFGTFIIFA